MNVPAAGAILLAVLLGIAPAVYAMPQLEGYYLLPVPQLIAGGLFGLLPFAMVLAYRWRGASGRERAGWWMAGLFVVCVHGAWVSTLGLQVLFFLHYPLFEAARLEARERFGPGTEGWQEDVHIGAFAFDAVGQTRGFQYEDQPPYFAAEQCPRHDYAHALDGRRESRMCFKGAGGVGFYFPEPGAPEPLLNQSAGGPLVGGWWWYVDD